MPQRRARVVVAAVAIVVAACAPGPQLGGGTEPSIPPSTTAVVPPTTVPETPTPDAGPPTGSLDLFPVAPEDLPRLDPVDGSIAFHGADAAIRSGRATLDLETGTLPAQPTWSRDGSRLAVVSLDGRRPMVEVFDGETGETLGTNPAERLYYFFSWSHDGSHLAALGAGSDENGSPQTVLDLLDADGAVVHTEVAASASLFVAWDPDAPRLVAHADDRLLRVETDGTAVDLGSAGLQFFAPKWIPGSDDVLVVADIEGSDFLVRRSIDASSTLRSLGEADTEIGISVNPNGEVAAISRTFEDEGGSEPQRIGVLAQTAPPLSGAIEILDLETAERVEVFTGLTRWAEWNPQGTHLLIHEADPEAGTGTWWVYAHDPDAVEPVPATEIVTYAPTPTFSTAYLPFADQYIESPRLWSPDGTRFVYPELTDAGSLVRTGDLDGADTPTTVGAGEVGFWSPSG